ncbi:acetyltransferase (GNAT) family protein [Kordia periserrulae]|uniref:Acetyltransferase (GNAT) family protein n=1 Tax=Kordia periserrulae TaxID=701523 RepID=A0A2T6BWN6_9FLAO|nr:GNAT family N-acetyltransferase [Kordia periserrulae]PTX60479.1 acetyltransferase (GNAT) family protein [Kordia periserrulae]
MEIKSLAHTPISTIVSTLNHAFSDYFVPINFTEEYVNERWVASGVDYTLSFGVFDKNELVGFLIHAINFYRETKVAYNASTGIIPKYRRQGLLTKLYEKAIAVLKEKGIQKSTLECITNNERAIAAYQKVGFSIDKKYHLYKFEWKGIEVETEFEIETKTDFKFSDFSLLQNYLPSIENQDHFLEKYKHNLIALSIFDTKERVAYLIFHKTSKRIHRLGVKNNNWEKYGTVLFSGLPNGNYNIINIDSENQNMHKFFKKMNFDNYIDQYDMSFDFAKYD